MNNENNFSNQLSIKLQDNSFEGPLSLLLHLIEKNKMDIYDIKISEITEQYLKYLEEKKQENIEIAAEFLVMASTLIYIKSRMLLPKQAKSTPEDDPRTELVMQLIAYRRCKVLADELMDRHNLYGECYTREPAKPADLDIFLVKIPAKPVSFQEFLKACEKISATNCYRFQDIRKRVHYLLQKDKLPLKSRIKNFWQKIQQSKRLFFFELIGDNATNSEKVSGFLAVLELLRMNQIIASQNKAFDVILMERNPEADVKILQEFLQSADNSEVIEYD